MKKTTTYWLIAATMTLAGCASDNDLANNYDGDGEAVNITATRSASTITTSTSTPLAEGETFRLINSTRQALGRTTKCDAVYVVDANGKAAPQNASNYVVWQTGIDIYGKQITENEFLAIIPADKEADSSLPTDQSSADKLKAADLQTASTTLPITSVAEGIDLTFAHQNAKLTFNVSLNDDASGITSIKVFNSIVPYFNTTANTIEAIVTPTASPASSLIAITLADGEQLNVALPHNIAAIEKGKQYNFSLTIGHNALTISSVSVSDWQNTTISGKNEAWSEEDGTEYVTFTADSEQGFTFVKSGEYSGDLTGFEYSVGNGAWIHIPIEGLTEPVKFGGTLGSLRLRGKSQYLFGTNCDRTVKFSNNTPVACSGDIRTLIDYTQYKTVDTGSAKFGFLFNGCTQLTTAPMLPATKLADNCYEGMFYGCTALTNAPALPATELTERCYYSMFYGCTALKSAPALPAEQLAKWCYYSMFYGCTALKSAPALPATELADNCYRGMFNGCTALKSAPALPAEKLALFCYNNMFNGCTALTQAPELKASTIKTSCYSYMFDGCSNLSSVTMLAEDVSVEHYLMQWLKNAGTSAQSRTLKLKNSDVYNALKSQSYYLPDNWKSDASGTTIIFEE